MKTIRTDKVASCSECGGAKELVQCSVREKGGVYKPDTYCQKCLNVFEQDEDNYFVFDH